MKKERLHLLFKLLALALIVLYGIALGAAWKSYNPMSTSVPFSFYVLLYGVPLLGLALAALIYSFILKKKYPVERKKPPMTGKKKLLIAGIVVISLILLVTLVPSLILHIFINRHCDYRGEETPQYALQGIYKVEEFGLSEKILTLKTSDGESLWASEIPVENPRAVVIYVSGIMQPSVTYFYGHAALMQEDSVASFLLELRAHGKSTGDRLGLGYTEVEDVRALLDYIKTQPAYDGLPVILQGVSMGGAVVLNAFGELPEVNGVIAMSPYASFETQLDLLMSRYGVPAFLRNYELFFLKRVLYINYGREAVDSLQPQKEILKADGRPVAVIACEEDSSVPVQNSLILKETADFIDLWIRPSWEHFIIKDCDFRGVAEDSEYCDYVKAFVEKVIQEQ